MWRFLVNITKDYDTYKETSSKHEELLKQRASEKAFATPVPQPIAVRNSAKPAEEGSSASVLANVISQYQSTNKRVRFDS